MMALRRAVAQFHVMDSLHFTVHRYPAFLGMVKLGVIEVQLRIVTRVDHLNPTGDPLAPPMGAMQFMRQFAALGVQPMQSYVYDNACFERVYAGAGGMGLYSYDGDYYGLPGRRIDGPRIFRE